MLKNTTFIIPIHKYDNDEDKEFLKRCLDSFQNQIFTEREKFSLKDLNVLMVYTNNLKSTSLLKDVKAFQKEYFFKVKTLENQGSYSYQGQVNLAVENIDTKYFTVVEYDDYLNSRYVAAMSRYILKNEGEHGGFMPVILEQDYETKGLASIWHLQGWHPEFTERKILSIPFNSLKSNKTFNLSGAVINTGVFKEVGGYKENLKIFFMYEFMLRFFELGGLKWFVVPKSVYVHTTKVPGSLTEEWINKYTQAQRMFWMEKSESEYHFSTDRKIEEPDFENIKNNMVVNKD